MVVEKWACPIVAGSCKITCSKLLIYAELQGLYYSNEIDCFGFVVGVVPDDLSLANARCMIVKFLC